MRALKLIFLFSLFAASFNSIGESRFGNLNDKVVKFYEEKLRAELKKQNAKESDYYGYYMEAAETLLAFGYYKYANKYFKEASKLSVAKLRSFNRVLATYKLLDNRKAHTIWVEKTNAFLAKNSEQKKGEDYRSFIIEKNTYGRSISSVEDNEALENSKLLGELKLKDAKNHFQNGDFEASFKILEEFDFSNVSLPTKVFYDLNKVLLKKKKSKSLCKKAYDRYPASPSFSMKICGYIQNYKSGKSLSKNEYNWIRTEIEKHYPEEKHLIRGLDELLGRKN